MRACAFNICICICVSAWLMLLLGCCYCCLAGFECTKQTVANVAWYVRGEGKKNRSKERGQRAGDRDRESGRRTQSSSESKVHVCVCVWVCQSMRVIKCVRGLSVSFSLLTLHKPFSCRTWQNSIATHTQTHAHIYITLTEREKSERATNMCR